MEMREECISRSIFTQITRIVFEGRPSLRVRLTGFPLLDVFQQTECLLIPSLPSIFSSGYFFMTFLPDCLSPEVAVLSSSLSSARKTIFYTHKEFQCRKLLPGTTNIHTQIHVFLEKMSLEDTAALFAWAVNIKHYQCHLQSVPGKEGYRQRLHT